MSKKGGGAKKAAKVGGGEGEEKLKPASQVKCRHILCEKQSKILEAKARIDGGEDFATVAREVSEDKARQGGDLGWFPRGRMVGDFEKVAFSLKKGEIGGPVKTVHGYHLIKCEDRK